MSIWNRAYNFITGKSQSQELEAIKPSQPVLPPTSGRKSLPDMQAYQDSLKSRYGNVKPEFDRESIPLIRNLVKLNPDFGLALNNVVSLANTGFKIFLDTDVKPEVADAMRDHIRARMKEWGALNFTSPSGLVDKMLKQLMIGGAIAVEWVPKNDLSGWQNIVYLKPENIEFFYKPSISSYEPYQKVTNLILQNPRVAQDNLVKLSPYTFKYVGIPSDTESPIGIPPFLTSLEPMEIDQNMIHNIGYIVEQIGLWGFLEVMLEKPQQIGGEGDAAYRGRLESHLVKAKERIQAGYRDGISVGYKDDVEFKFNSTTKDSSNVRSLYNVNWNRKIRGLKSDPALFGGDDSRSETQIAIVFTKMLSELVSYQNLVKEVLEFGIERELLMAGYKFKKLNIKFNQSTLQDALKFEQAREIRIRNNHALYWDGVHSLEDYAEDMGYDKPDEKEPRVMRGITNSGDPQDKQQREKAKDASDRKARESKKPQGNNDR